MEPVANDRPRPFEDGEAGITCQATQPPAVTPPQFGRILVIRLSGLGDSIMALPAMPAIRTAHPAADITLLTSKSLAELGKRSGWFNRVEIDTRPRWNDIGTWWRLRRWLKAGR